MNRSVAYTIASPDTRGITSLNLTVLGAAVLFACAMPCIIEFGGARSVYVRVNGQWSDYAIGVIWAALIACTIAWWPVRRSMKVPLLWAWLFRVFMTLVVSLPYFSHYSALDSYVYFDSRTVFPDPLELGFGHGTQNFIALVWGISRIVPDSFHAMNVTFALFGLIGMFCFWMASERFLGFSSRPIFYLLMLEPSLTFWTASIGKESVMTFGVGLYSYAVVTWWRTRRGCHLWQAATGILIVSLIRTQMAGILVAPLIVLVYARQRRILSRILTTVLVGASVYTALPFILKSIFLEAAQDLTEQVASLSERFNLGDSAGSAFALSGPVDLIRYAPLGMFGALFRPLPGDVLNAFGILASMEDVLFLALFARAMMRSRPHDLRDPLVAWALAVVVLWPAIYAFVSSQNYGTAVRYRIQILPIFLGLMLYLGRSRVRFAD